ncbi:MAG: glycosyltransferase family 9 protein [Patescibacteria group bacterium]|jgi:ADP-heptose:LPS heptosyltransferase/gas vesicle protein
MPESGNQPTPDQIDAAENGRQVEKISIVDVSDSIESHAVDTGEEKLTAKPEDTRGFRGKLRAVWKHNWLREYYRDKEVRKARQNIMESGNLYANESGDKTAHDQAMEAVADRFTQEFDEAIHREAGEVRELLDETQEQNPEEREQVGGIKDQIRQLIKDYATGELPDKETFDQEKARLFTTLKGARPGVIERGDMYADNLWLVANKIRTKIEREENKDSAFERLNLQFDVYVGKAKEGVRTEAQFNAVDRVVERIHRNPVGKWVNETTLASAVALAYCVGTKLSQSVARKAAYATGAFVGGAIAGAAFGAMAEAKRTEEERKKHFRDMAKNKKWDPDRSPRRVEMEGYRYETKSTQELMSGIRDAVYEGGRVGEPRELTPEQFQSAMAQLAEIEARVTISDRDKIDLLTYSDVRKVERERCELAKIRYQAKSALRSAAEQAGMIPDNRSFDDFFGSLRETQMEQMVDGTRQKNEEFRKFKRARAWKAGIKGLAIGVGVGMVAQEVRAFFDDKLQGGVESWVGRKDNVPFGEQPKHTLLQQLNRWLAIGKEAQAAPGDEKTIVNLLGHKHTLPKGFDFSAKNPDGTYDIVKIEDGEPVPAVKGLTFDANGDLTSQARGILKDSGVYVEERKTPITTMVDRTRKVGAGEILDKYKQYFDRIHRRLWYDNNTPGLYDKNELKLWWGGSNGVDPKGNVVFNVSHMTPRGSYHDSLSTNAQRLISGNRMKMLFSMSRETQKFCYDVPVDGRGNAIIDKDNPLIKVLFKFDASGKMMLQDGHPVPNFRFCEAAQTFGEGKDGCENFRILATYEGPGVGNSTIVDKVPVVTQEHNKIWSLPTPDSQVDVPFMPPIIGRAPLEPIEHGPSPEPLPHVPDYSAEHGSDRLKKHFTEISRYRNSADQAEKLVAKLPPKYEFLRVRLNELKNFNRLDPVRQEHYKRELERHNKRRFGDNTEKYIGIDEYVNREMNRAYYQAENILLEESAVGDAPYEPEFYEHSPLIKGLERADEVVVIFDYPLGDAILTVPILEVIKRYYDQTGHRKPIKLVTTQPGLFRSVNDQYPGLVEIVDYKEIGSAFRDNKERFIINAHKNFEDYSVFGLSGNDANDLSRVMSVDWNTWQMEESPENEQRAVKYDPIPARIMRNFEIMLGRKLVDNINAENHFMEKGADFDARADEIRDRYGLERSRKLIVISAGSSVMPKEYRPERWAEVLEQIKAKYPDAQILFIDDPDPQKSQRYGEMVDRLRSGGHRIVRAKEPLNNMPVIMEMADLSITPDTGLGHLAGAFGTPNIMIILGNPVQWSTARTHRVMHEKARDAYRESRGTYDPAWRTPNSYYTDEGVGASDIEPERVMREVERILG